MTTTEYLAERDRIVRVLIARRKELGLTQRELGAKICAGIRSGNPWSWQAQVGRWETGVWTPRLDSLIKWSQALGLRLRFDHDD